MEEQRIVHPGTADEPIHRIHHILPRRELTGIQRFVSEQDNILRFKSTAACGVLYSSS